MSWIGAHDTSGARSIYSKIPEILAQGKWQVLFQFAPLESCWDIWYLLGLAFWKFWVFFVFFLIFQWGNLLKKHFASLPMLGNILNMFYFLCGLLYKFKYSSMLQDEDADFLAKLAKLIGAAGTQLLNSYNK